MTVLSAYLQLYGDQFSPKQAEIKLGYELKNVTEPGPSVRDPYQRERGAATLHFEWDAAGEPGFEDGIADLLPSSLPIFADESLIPALRESGAEEFVLYVGVTFSGQCNMELSPALLGALAKLGVVLAISCCEDDDDLT